jgi:hypothetical protein
MVHAIKAAVRVRSVDAADVVLRMVGRIARADDLDDGEKVQQIKRVLAALARIQAMEGR